LTRGQERFRLPTALGLDEYFYVPEDNRLTPEKIELGRRLFFDKLLSADRSIACSSCHKPELAFSDGLTVSVGIGGRKGTRSAPAIINRAYGKSFFWDGRAAALEEQVLHPIQNPIEMNLTLEELTTRLKADANYTEEFLRAFADGVTPINVARVLACFVRTLRSGNSPFDKFQLGDQAALSSEARRGLELFRGKANCVACHVGPNFTDEQFHNTGVAWHDGRFADDGRYAVTQQEKDRGAFKTPTLREVSRTAPYMHDGSITTLEEVIEYYNRGGNLNPNIDNEVRRFRLTTEEKRALLTFLRSLNGTNAQRDDIRNRSNLRRGVRATVLPNSIGAH
jgi:cytochrome c peroxidase